MTANHPLQIAVIGAGAVGTNLARRFAEAGHGVRFGARDVASTKVRAAVASVDGSSAMPIASAVEGADLVVLAVPAGAVPAVLDAIEDLAGSVVVDATNAVGVPVPDGAEHLVELIRRLRPEAVVVKAFNTIGAEAYLDPTIDGRPVFLPIAGPEPAASLVRDLAATMGFDAMVIGDVEAVPLLEWHARLWIHLAFRAGLGRDFGFARVVRT